MKISKGVLEEELKNSLREQAEYEKALAGLPREVLVKKFVKGHQYYYLMMREGKKDRTKYRKLRGEVKKRIAFLRRTLEGKELRAVS